MESKTRFYLMLPTSCAIIVSYLGEAPTLINEVAKILRIKNNVYHRYHKY